MKLTAVTTLAACVLASFVAASPVAVREGAAGDSVDSVYEFYKRGDSVDHVYELYKRGDEVGHVYELYKN